MAAECRGSFEVVGFLSFFAFSMVKAIQVAVFYGFFGQLRM